MAGCRRHWLSARSARPDPVPAAGRASPGHCPDPSHPGWMHGGSESPWVWGARHALPCTQGRGPEQPGDTGCPGVTAGPCWDPNRGCRGIWDCGTGVSMLLWAQGSFLPLLFFLLTPLPPAPRSILPPGGIWPHLSQIHLASQIPSCRWITLPSAGLRPAERGWGRGADTPYPVVLDSSAHSTSEHNPAPRAQHIQEPLPSPPGTPTAAGETRSALHQPPSRTPAPGEGSGTHGSGTLRACPRHGHPYRLAR